MALLRRKLHENKETRVKHFLIERTFSSQSLWQMLSWGLHVRKAVSWRWALDRKCIQTSISFSYFGALCTTVYGSHARHFTVEMQNYHCPIYSPHPPVRTLPWLRKSKKETERTQQVPQLLPTNENFLNSNRTSPQRWDSKTTVSWSH